MLEGRSHKALSIHTEILEDTSDDKYHLLVRDESQDIYVYYSDGRETKMERLWNDTREKILEWAEGKYGCPSSQDQDIIKFLQMKIQGLKGS